MREIIITKIKVKPGSGLKLRRHNKVGRNDACPCGSGKKFKNCCLPGRAK